MRAHFSFVLLALLVGCEQGGVNAVGDMGIEEDMAMPPDMACSFPAQCMPALFRPEFRMQLSALSTDTFQAINKLEVRALPNTVLFEACPAWEVTGLTLYFPTDAEVSGSNAVAVIKELRIMGGNPPVSIAGIVGGVQQGKSYALSATTPQPVDPRRGLHQIWMDAKGNYFPFAAIYISVPSVDLRDQATGCVLALSDSRIVKSVAY